MNIRAILPALSVFPIIILFAVSAPNAPALASPGDAYVYQPPPQLDDGWAVSTLDACGMDTELITRLTNRIIDGKYKGLHSILIVKNGAIVHEHYFDDYDRNSLQTIYSITKSVTSALVGIAIDKGFIKNTDESLLFLLPHKYARSVKGDVAKEITLRHILTLTSGLEWDEKSYPYCDDRNSEYNKVRSDDWVKYVLQRPLRDAPGTRYVYNTGSVHVLSAVIKCRTGLYADQFARKYLFEPLGIEAYGWSTDPNGYPCTGGTRGGLSMKTRDLAKFGYLFLNNGRWRGKQIISGKWVEESTRTHAPAFDATSIGYLWWNTSYTIKNEKIDIFYGAGYGGQSLTVVPALDLMFVFTCWGRSDDADIWAPMLTILNSALTGRPDPTR